MSTYTSLEKTGLMLGPVPGKRRQGTIAKTVADDFLEWTELTLLELVQSIEDHSVYTRFIRKVVWARQMRTVFNRDVSSMQ